MRKWSGDPPGCLEVVGRLSSMSGIGREAIQDDQEWSGDTPVCSGVVGRPSRMSGSGLKTLPKSESGRETLANVPEWSKGYLECPRGPLRCPGVVGSPSQMSRSDREALLDVRKW